MNCEQFELIQHLNQLQNDINTLISSIQEISLAQAAVLFIRKALTSKDVFSATSEATNIINKFSNGEELPEETNGESDRTVAPVNTAKSGTAHLRRPEDLLYNLSAKILVYTNGIEISQQKMGTKFGMAVPSGDMGGGFDDDGDDDFPADDDMDEWRPPGAPRGGGGAKTARKHTGRGRPPKRKTSTPAQNSKKQRKNSPRRALQRAPQDDMFAVFKQENPDSEWAADDENGFGGFPVQMIKQEQLEFDESQEHDLSESLDMMYDNQDDDDDDEEEGEEVETPCGKGGYPTGVSQSERMRDIAAFVRSGVYPRKKMDKYSKQNFRRRCRLYQLFPGEVLMRTTKDGIPKKVIPERMEQLRLIKEAHEAVTENYKFKCPENRHLGRDKTVANICDKFFWHRMKEDVVDFIHNCEGCRNQGTSGPLLCPDCGRVCKTGRALVQHMMTHTDERPFSCDQCPATFKQASGLKLHTMAHNGDRPHKCDQCEKSFITKKSLMRHYVIHTGERPYLCTICGNTFTQKETLDRHRIRIHATSPRAHVCTVCGKEFVEKPTLIRHMRTHTGEKPFSCPHCGRSFSIKYKMKLHVETFASAVPQHCSKCAKSFMWKCAFDTHNCQSEPNEIIPDGIISSSSSSFAQQYEQSLGVDHPVLAADPSAPGSILPGTGPVVPGTGSVVPAGDPPSNVVVAPVQTYPQIVSVNSTSGMPLPVLVTPDPSMSVNTFPQYP